MSKARRPSGRKSVRRILAAGPASSSGRSLSFTAHGPAGPTPHRRFAGDLKPAPLRRLNKSIGCIVSRSILLPNLIFGTDRRPFLPSSMQQSPKAVRLSRRNLDRIGEHNLLSELGSGGQLGRRSGGGRGDEFDFTDAQAQRPELGRN
jgi:hypothetical protein